MRLARHQMVQLDPTAWPALLSVHPELDQVPAVRDWTIRRRPLISRQRLSTDPPEMVPLALPLPPSMGKRRLAFSVVPDAVLSSGLPPRLSEAITTAPVTWRPALRALVAAAPAARCFGSLAWEHLTGLPYLSPESDVDLLWHASTATDADRLVAAIAQVELAAPMRIDGELVTPAGSAVQWREWASGTSGILAKTRFGSRMVHRAAVFA